MARDPIGKTVRLASGVRATVVERVDGTEGPVYLLRVLEEDSTMATILTVPAAELSSMEIVRRPASRS